MEFTCQDFKVGKCDGEKLVDGEIMPLVLQPPDPIKNDYESLVEALKENKEWFEQLIIKNSAVLLRGFDVKNVEEFNEVVELFGWENVSYVGPAPRTQVHKRIWTANEGPLSEFIYFHHEMTLIPGCPNKIIFFCEIPPPEGGETPIVPSFRVTERMVEEFPEMVEEMGRKGLKYTLISPRKNDTSSMLGRGWEDAFGTSDPAEAEKRGKLLGMDFEWLPNGGLKTIVSRPLTKVLEGRKGRRMWFNLVVGRYGKEHSSAIMGDGTEISKNVVKRCEEIMEEESIQFKWEKGDILFLDNMAVLHGRRPSLPPRTVLATICK